MRIAFLGLGLMGSRMSRRLADAGYPLSLWNRSVLPSLQLPANSTLAATAADAAQGADIVFCCVSDTQAVDAVLFGENGAAERMRAGSLFVDCSSISPAATRKMAARLFDSCGARWIDAPVSGGTGGAERGELVVFAGGDEADIERLRPCAAAFSRRLTRMGNTGSGQLTKLCNQLIVASNAVLIAEAVALAEQGGVDARALAPALAGGFADSLPLQILAPRMSADSFEPVQWKVSTLLKDLDNALAAAEGTPLLPLATHARALIAAHAAAGHADADLSTLVLGARAGQC
ncbi:NAD(P)-dependent oxidoreductase [Crenobacter caeni]|nr:NAD(P)-dependent oxidoreductase [Crenobacter caeni]